MTKKEKMAAFSPKFTGRYNVRSISLPARSHPSTNRIEEELNKLRSLEVSCSSNSETIYTCLSGLTELYKCIEGLFSLPEVQQALAQHHHKKLVNELLDGSVRYLDICGNTRDAILLMKESVRELQSALRRKKGGELSIESYVRAYICSRKKMKKETAKSLNALKELDSIFKDSLLLDLNYLLSMVVKVVREASLITGSIFRSLFSFLSAPVLKPKPTKWSLVLILVNKGVAASEGQQESSMNEMESVDVALSKFLLQNVSEDIEAERIQSALTRLEAMDVSIENFEKGLECLFRHMIQARVSLLNIFSI